ncbi:MAG: 16S rRNA (uracil(1498)-N(3))-methyltransferase [Acidimicrobiales bacterium]|nr:16S rRNA (uracil(1498)-N(3))-methyltransferase [Acidimicrobiales bacterium]MCB9372829.1 16S rRNA (uracil(1498)-N(3))-methyltransferase [Microthrixaceae bacterium]
MGPTPTAKAHAFVVDLDAPELDEADRHHLDRVLRLARGDLVTVADGQGAWRECRFGPVLEPAGPVVVERPPTPPVTVCFAPVKGDRPEWAVQKLTELGVDVIVPLGADRSVVRWAGERATRHVERLRRVAREAAMQCRRPTLPVVEDVRTFADVAARPGALLADPTGRSPQRGDALVLVGPEGGWSDAERARAVPAVRLGPTVLRAETAAVVAGALLTALRPGGALAES